MHVRRIKIKMNRACLAGLVMLFLGHEVSLRAQESAAGDDLTQHLATLRAQADDTSLAIGQREALIQEMAGVLDRAAQSAGAADQRQERWARAVGLLDEFNNQNPGHPRTREFQLQAAVYRWAQGQGWQETSELNPGNSRASREAALALDDAIVRLRAVHAGDDEKVLADNIRFRLARALADRASLEPITAPDRRSREADALALMKEPMTEAGLRGFSGLLKADLLLRASRLDEAAAVLDAVARTDPPPPEREILDVRIPVLIGQKKYKEAEAVIAASHLDPAGKELALVRMRLTELAGQTPGTDRLPLEKDLFQRIKTLRQGKNNEARLGLLALASGIEPDPRNAAEAWDILAERTRSRAMPSRRPPSSSALPIGRGARPGRGCRGISPSRRGIPVPGGQVRRGRRAVLGVAEDPGAGVVRAKAGMLRAMARGRELASGAPGVTASDYASALQQQIVSFPADPATDEGRGCLAR